MMYAVDKVIVRSRPRRGDWAITGPLLSICCLIFMLFLMASVVVLALIPLYLPTKSATAGGFTRNFSFVLTSNSSLGLSGNLPETSVNNIADAISMKLGFPQGATTIHTSTVVTLPSKRKRRGFDLMGNRRRRADDRQQIFLVGGFNRKICGQCRIVAYKFPIVVMLYIDGFFIRVEFIVEIFIIVINPPKTLSTSTSTRTSTVSEIATTLTISKTASNSTVSKTLTTSTVSTSTTTTIAWTTANLID